MSNIEQQTKVDEFLDGLKSIEHPIPDFFVTLRDFENPTPELYKRIDDYYLTFSFDDIQMLIDYVFGLHEILSSVYEGIKKIGINIGEGQYSHDAIGNFGTYLCEIKSEIYHREHPEVRLQEEKLRESKKMLEGEIQRYVNEMRLHLTKQDSDLDIHEIIESLNTLFSTYGLMKKSEMGEQEKVQIQTIPHLKVPDISDRWRYYIVDENRKGEEDEEEGYENEYIFIHAPFEILFKMLEYFWKREDFWKQIETFRPNQETLTILESDKMKYGAKGAYLRFLKNLLFSQARITENAYLKDLIEGLYEIKSLLDDEQNLLENTVRKTKNQILNAIHHIDKMDGFHIELLPSLEIDTELYTSWKSGKDINEELKAIYERARNEFSQDDREDETDYFSRKKGLPKEISGLIVRSSAVYSEDSEKTSGAGIYESVGDIYSVDDFKRAVQGVFESVESEKAQVHRKAFDIPEEYMGLVVMPFMHSTQKSMGYINMARPGKSNLVDIKDMSGKHAVLQKDLLPIDLLTQLHFGTFISHMYQVDTRSSEVGFQMSDMGLASSLKTMFFLSQYFSHPLQFEIISESSMRRERVFIVQMRPLNFQNQQNLSIPEFPNQEPIYEGNAIVACDIIVDVDDIFIRNSSYEATTGRLLDTIGAYKAVIIIDSFSAISGHIETLCSERGIPCICENRFEQAKELDLSSYKQVRIVSDGEFARIYPA